MLKKKSLSYMFSFEVKPSIMIGFSFYWSWVWIVFWSASFYGVAPQESFFGTLSLDSLGPLWIMSLTAMSVVLLLLYHSISKGTPLGLRAANVILAAVLTSAGTGVVAFSQDLFSSTTVIWAYAIGAAVLGAGSAFEFALWGELVTVLGARQSIVYFVSSTVLSVVVFALAMMADPVLSRMMAACLPIASMVLFSRHRPILKNLPKRRTDAETVLESTQRNAAAGEKNNSSKITSSRQALMELLLIALFFGVSYGIMKGCAIFAEPGSMNIRYQLNGLALLVGSLAIFLTMGVFRMDFRRLTYQIALPLMAVGFVLLFERPPWDMVGFFLHQVGYQYFYAIIWAMWPVLSSLRRAPHAQAVCVGMFGVQFGQLFGSIVGAQFMVTTPDAHAMGLATSLCVFVTLLVALFGFGNPISGDAWIMVRPFGNQTEKRPKFKLSVENLIEVRGLSVREGEVFSLLAKGRNKQSIAKQLCVSENTAKTHIKNVYRKLGVHSQQALMDMIELDAKNN